jgi:hypothetical protein
MPRERPRNGNGPRPSRKVWVFSAELVTKVDKHLAIAEPPAEVAEIIDAIVAHPR